VTDDEVIGTLQEAAESDETRDMFSTTAMLEIMVSASERISSSTTKESQNICV
jgi:hypothetical protein